MGPTLNKIRNRFESSDFGLSILDKLTNNQIYRKYINQISEKKINKIKKNKSYNFGIENASFCNAHCTFCPNAKMKRKKMIMSMEVFSKIVDRIKKEGIAPTQFNMSGTGEPLIDKNLFKKIRLLKKEFPEATVFFPTNLNLANENIRKNMIDSGLDNISVSLNANFAKDYKKIMGLDYKTTIDNLNKLISMRNKAKSKLKINLKLAANPVNKDSIDKFIGKWEKRVDSIGVSWIHSWAGSVANGSTNEDKIPRYPCRQIFEQIVILANGDVALCCIDYEGTIIGGNVMKDKILDAFYSLKINKIRQMQKNGKIRDIKLCSKCRFSERGLYWLIG